MYHLRRNFRIEGLDFSEDGLHFGGLECGIDSLREMFSS